MSTGVFAFSYTVTLNEGQGHSNWYQTIECNDVYHHTNCERNRSRNSQMQAYLIRSFQSDSLPYTGIIRDKMNMRFTKPSSLNGIPNSIQIHSKLCEILDAEVFAVLHSHDLESKSRVNRVESNVELCNIIAPCLKQIGSQTFVWIQTLQLFKFLMQLVKQHFPSVT